MKRQTAVVQSVLSHEETSVGGTHFSTHGCVAHLRKKTRKRGVTSERKGVRVQNPSSTRSVTVFTGGSRVARLLKKYCGALSPP